MSQNHLYPVYGKGKREFKILKGGIEFVTEKSGLFLSGFRLYPNPTSEFVFVEIFENADLDEIKIYNYLTYLKLK